MKRTILCDLDDTLVDARWRMPHWGDWDKFYGLSSQDRPIEPMCDLVRFLGSSFKVHILTAREERYRTITREKLDELGIWHHKLIMRPNNACGIGSAQLKISLAELHLGKNWRDEVCLVIDDREDVLAAFREQGIVTLQTEIPAGLEKI